LFKLSLTDLDSQLSHLHRKLFGKRELTLIDNLLDSPTYQSDYDLTRLRIPTRKAKNLIGLAVMSWYMSEEIRTLLQLELRSVWPADYYEVGEVLLTSKEYMLAWLIIQDQWNEFDFFGNVLDKRLSRIWNLVTFFRKPRTPVKKYTGWCRGYQESYRRVKFPLPIELTVGVISFEEDLIRQAERERKLLSLVRKIEIFLSSA
jgi:hypothetical protein